MEDIAIIKRLIKCGANVNYYKNTVSYYEGWAFTYKCRDSVYISIVSQHHNNESLNKIIIIIIGIPMIDYFTVTINHC